MEFAFRYNVRFNTTRPDGEIAEDLKRWFETAEHDDPAIEGVSLSTRGRAWFVLDIRIKAPTWELAEERGEVAARTAVQSSGFAVVESLGQSSRTELAAETGTRLQLA